MLTQTAGGVRIQLRIGDDVATATLQDTAPARDLAAMVPVTAHMPDLFGREKPGQLPRALDMDGAARESNYEVARSPTGPRTTTSRSSTPTTARPSPGPAGSGRSTPAWRRSQPPAATST
ncbi:MAG: hypothetical protein JO309_02685 [Pseudonocardiales bacterium]|nr:hypothetical protein [Pseudonocardiales bacterium]MBV9728322.1 hypothetical protein [Pseudonocardiales bacterium]